MEEATNKRSDSFAILTDDVVVEILRRLPTRSLFRCKMVCKSWKTVISDPKYLKLLPQTVVGFFYDMYKGYQHFTSVTGEEFSLEFLPFKMDNVAVCDCCNGLILCWCHGPDGYRYVVCNPATKKLKVLPPSNHSVGEARLAFDPTASAHFHVIEYIVEEGECLAVDIYSSETAAWISKESGWGARVLLCHFVRSASVFLNSCLHMIGFSDGYSLILAMDMEGKRWRKIPRPGGVAASIHQAQGHLCVCTLVTSNKSQFSVWILEDYGTNEWTLKHTISTLNVFEKTNIEFGHVEWDEYYTAITVHPEWNLIFFVGENRTIIAYDMDSGKVHVIPTRIFPYGTCSRFLTQFFSRPFYIPYVPLYSESLA